MTSAAPRALLLPDRGDDVGDGHIGRTVALGEALSRGGCEVELLDGGLARWAERLEAAGIARVDRAAESPDVVVVDSYRRALLDRAEAVDAPVCQITDHGIGALHGATLVVDQNVGADVSAYAGWTGGTLLVGPRYALLRSETTAAIGSARPIEAMVSRVVLAAGAAPPEPVRALFRSVRSALGLRHDVAELIGVTNVGEFLAGADLVVTAGGSTVLDLLALGRPAVVIACAENQRPVARRCGRLGVAVDAGDAETASAAEVVRRVDALIADLEARRAMSARGSDLVDGLGASRVALQVRALMLSCREVVPADRDLLLRWANDARVRAAAFDPAPISSGDHERWFAAKLADAGTHMVIVSHRGEPIGQARFEATRDGSGDEIDVSIARQHRGRGWAAPLLVAATAWRFERDDSPTSLVARVKADNLASRRAFESAGFRDQGDRSDGRLVWRSYALLRDEHPKHCL